MGTMQSPSEEEASISQVELMNVPIKEEEEQEQKQEENMVPKPNGIKEQVQKEEESVKEIKEVKQERREEQEKIVHEKDGDYMKSPNSSEYYSTLSSFDNEYERRIPIDPISFSERELFEEDGPLSMPSVFTEVTMQSPILPPVRTPRFVSASLPCSATSSPHYSFSSYHQRYDEPNLQPNSSQSPRTLARQHSLALTRFASTRSMSFAEERTLAHNDTFQMFGITRQSSSGGSTGSSSSTSSESPKMKPKTKGAKEDDFKCNALCMYLPSFSKKKQMQLRHQATRARGDVSRLASLEKFNCGSSSPTSGDACDTHMPVELERSSTHDTESPIRTAFLFDGVERRGILKKSSSRFGSAKSLGSTNTHVRFSVANSAATSCPSSPTVSVSSVCISPRLRKVREEFSAFLEAAQSS